MEVKTNCRGFTGYMAVAESVLGFECAIISIVTMMVEVGIIFQHFKRLISRLILNWTYESYKWAITKNTC